MTIVSADGHIDLMYMPPNAFVERMDSCWSDRIPHVVERDGRRVWMSGDAALAASGSYGTGIGSGDRGRILASRGFSSGERRPSTPAQRLEDQQDDGVDAEVIYGIIAISKGFRGYRSIRDPELLTAVYRAYNEWVVDFGNSLPRRFFGLGCIPNHDPRAAARETAYCARLGLKGVVFVPWGCPFPIWHEMWEPLWATAEDSDLVLSFHAFEGGAATVGREVQGVSTAPVFGSWAVVAPMQLDEILVSLILSGVCERHPNLRIVLGESGIGWLPYLLERMDDTYRSRLTNELELSCLPSDYFRRQIYATFQKDTHGVRAMAELAPDNVMWGSDYPHRDGTWPNSRSAIAEQFQGIDEKIKRKMLSETVRSVYGLEL